MTVGSVAPQDATMFWLSGRTRNDLFLLYCFTDTGVPSEELRARVAARAALVPDLSVRLREVPRDLSYPSWVPCAFADDQFFEHHLPECTWPAVESALGTLLATGVDATHRPWRLHVFRAVTGAPTSSGPVTVAVLQMSHALADGRHAATLARALFTDLPQGTEVDAVEASVPLGKSGGPARSWFGAVPSPERVGAVVDAVRGLAEFPFRMVGTVVFGVGAFRAQRELAALTEAGEVPAAGGGFAPSAVNLVGDGEVSRHRVRMIVCQAGELRVPDYTVTVVVLTAVSVALSEYLAGEQRLGAQVPMALDGKARARNNYRSLGIDLFADEPDLRARARRIADDLDQRRRRARHPLLAAQDRVTTCTPAPILRRDVARYPLDVVPDALAGHTVVSSVHRGPADLAFGGPVLFTAGFPALGSVMHLTHGVHGLGDTVTLSLHADLPDLDRYATLLRTALSTVPSALAAAP
ncbi:hypothetical protein IU433_28640 [Nocardia puris]|uniref:wax ester/triacylglycerol synthase domain-containing protein n=1 Tax=Nocardia puris TaxID=208602 RepID=UPI001896020D|nr:wax ester/triacylglycerol synthase domain-containing protein [Nocardia puris]MBF6213850.1 hypothetical protein [Nocardia puris]MBF6368489.1 hypothetical protein [Nocardia puris]MBF6462976.1 hypothetical protein [Nocardia puris]